MSRVVVLGSLNRDLEIRVDRHPSPGETLLGGDAVYRFGGKGANQAVAARLAGARTAMVGAVGDDEAGDAYRARLASFGIDASAVRVVADTPTGLAVVYLDADGENMIVVAPGANTRVGTAEVTVAASLTADDVLVMPMEVEADVAVAAIRAAAASGARVILNLAPYTDLPDDVLAAADPVVVNEHEAALLEASGRRPGSLLVTLGEAGARWGELTVPAAVTEVVDTTGAGDAFTGTLAAALADGADREQAMILAAEAAGRCVSRVGAQPELS